MIFQFPRKFQNSYDTEHLNFQLCIHELQTIKSINSNWLVWFINLQICLWFISSRTIFSPSLMFFMFLCLYLIKDLPQNKNRLHHFTRYFSQTFSYIHIWMISIDQNTKKILFFCWLRETYRSRKINSINSLEHK